MPNRKLNVLYAREYRLEPNGPVYTDYHQCGVAFENERGVDVRLWFVPPAIVDPLNGAMVRLKLRWPRPPLEERGAEPDPDKPVLGAEPARRPPVHRDGLAAQGTLREIPLGSKPPPRR